MSRPIRDLLLDTLASAAGGVLGLGAGGALVDALEIEGLIERGSNGYEATAAGLATLENRGRMPALSGQVAVLFTDVVSSTRLIERLGDRDAHLVMGRHFGLLRSAVAQHAGREVKSLGDGLMVVFGSVADAVACAAAMHAAVARHGDGLQLRIGIDAGEPVHEAGDYFGAPVVVAKRLCDAGRSGQTLVSDCVQRLVAEHEFESVGDIALKGLSASVHANVLAVAA